jgi:hypothetical protein
LDFAMPDILRCPAAERYFIAGAFRRICDGAAYLSHFRAARWRASYRRERNWRRRSSAKNNMVFS